jgi:N,N'-diacetyllegionaminate synthase
MKSAATRSSLSAEPQMTASISIGRRRIGPGEPVFIIAEAGVNHGGNLDAARRLVDAAVAAGADAVKFQTFKPEKLVSSSAPKVEYQLHSTDGNESQLQMLQRLQLSPDATHEVYEYCRRAGILFLSTPFDEASADFLDPLVPALKVSSCDVNNVLLLSHIARYGKPVLLSTGMAYLAEVDAAIRTLRTAGCEQVAVLHCLTNYPADPAETNLRAMQTMASAFNVPVGYSDHTMGIEISIAAVAMGACIVEKHFTLDRDAPGPDNRASLEPSELRDMVRAIRLVESALGTWEKVPAASEMGNRAVVRRSLAAAFDLASGTVLSREQLTALRPGSGIAPDQLCAVLGRTLRRPLRAGELIAWQDLA